MTKIYDPCGKGQRLGSEIKAGGEGTVFDVECRPTAVVKVYHPELRDEQQRQAKIAAQINVLKQNPILAQLPLAWPRMAIFDQHQQWLGYVMPKVSGMTLSLFRNPKKVKQRLGGIDRVDVTEYLINLFSTVNTLHQHNIFLGDINLDNFLVDPLTRKVHLIDCDSYQFVHNRTCYPCPVGQDAMIPPEHQGKNLRNVERNAQSDCFSLAVICFMLLMSGRHPYEHIGGTSTVENIKKGHFPYGQKIRPGSQGSIPVGPWYTWWSHLTFKLKSAFIQTFTDGAHDPNKRIGVKQWITLLEQYKWSLENNKGDLSRELWPTEVKSSAYKADVIE
ncbi:TPA: protein kinase domain-containing protein [Photobacterium damselae]